MHSILLRGAAYGLAAIAVAGAWPRGGYAQRLAKDDLRRKEWQELANNLAPKPREKRGSPFEDRLEIFSYFTRFSGDCEVQIARILEPPTANGDRVARLELRFVQAEKRILTLPVHPHTPFLAVGNELYVAQYQLDKPGCIVSAYSLDTGERKWKTADIAHVGSGPHSGYSNSVEMRLSNDGDVTGENDNDSIIILGREEVKSYSAVIDRRTGEVISHAEF